MYRDWVLLCTVVRCLFRDHLTIYVCLSVPYIFFSGCCSLSLTHTNTSIVCPFLCDHCCFVLSINFRWHLFCLLFVSVCTFEMFCYASRCVEKRATDGVFLFYFPILTLIANALVWLYALLRSQLDCHQAIRFFTSPG